MTIKIKFRSKECVENGNLDLSIYKGQNGKF